MTEDEAKMKWCHRTMPGPRKTCIASACMAWRWYDQWTSLAEEGQGGDLVLRLKRKPGEPKLGYCGLAGAPQ